MDWINNYKKDFILNISLAYPIMLGQMGQIMVNLADNLMVGRLGAEDLAAVSVANAIFVIFLVVGMGISFALPPLVSEAHGAKEEKKISQYFKHSLIINIVFAAFSFVIILFGEQFLYYLGQQPEVLIKAKPYLLITAWSIFPLMLFQTLRCYADGLSRTILPMVAIIIGNLLNIVLNYGFIFGQLGLPELGVTGAAVSSLIARMMMLILLLFILFRSKSLWQHISMANYFSYKKALFKKTLSLGIPSSLQMFFEVSAFSAAALIMGLIGEVEQAAHQISINLASVTFLICTGLAMAATIRVGNQLGKKDYPKLRDAGFSAIVQVTLFMFVTAILFILLRYWLPWLYISDNSVISIAALLLVYAALFQIPDGVQVTALGALRGIQDVKIPTLITFCSYWCFGIPISYLASQKFNFGPSGVWIGLIVGLSLSATLLTYRFHILSQKRISENRSL